jgi:Tol biopolymer transport system component
MDRSPQVRGVFPIGSAAVGQSGARLDSWKEIASYLGRSEKTVRRWEEKEDLPVHRLLHEKRGSVYAYTAEVDAWRETRRTVIDVGPSANEIPPQNLTALKKTPEPAGVIAGLTRRRKAAVIAIAIAAVVTTGLVWLLARHPYAPSSDLIEERLTYNSSGNPVLAATLSPDGKYLAYSDLAGIHVRLLATGEERAISIPGGISTSSLSYVDSWFPDGTRLLAHSKDPAGRGIMWTVSVMGQSPRELRGNASGWEVSPDGTRIAFSPSRPFTDAREIWVMDSEADNPRRVLGIGASEGLWSVHWSPDGQRLAYIRARYPRQFLETSDLNGMNRTEVVSISESDPWLQDIAWLKDGRIIYSQLQWPESEHADLWHIGVDTHSGVPTGKAKRITRWTGSNLWSLSANADVKRLAFQKLTSRAQIYWSELGAGGTRMSPPERLTNDEGNNSPAGWALDSKAVFFTSNRNGKWGIFKQGLPEGAAEPLVSGREAVFLSRLSPDGSSVVYIDVSRTASGRVPVYRLMRVPVNGGIPRSVFEIRQNWATFNCSAVPAKGCAILELSDDEKQLTLIAFDPLKGNPKPLRTIQNDPLSSNSARPACWQFAGALSPDGSTFAIAKRGEAQIHIHLLSLSGGADREVTVRDWPNISGLDWSADGKGFYCGSISPKGSALLHLNLRGESQVLWQSREVATDGAFLAGIPSADGRSLAILRTAYNSNVWMLEGL